MLYPIHKRLAVAALVLSLCLRASAQYPLHPPVEFYGKEHYKAASHNWAVTEGLPGELLIGNDQGLLRYDGYRWELKYLPGGVPVYAVLVDGDRIYTGGIREFGYWTRTPGGDLQYTSLSALVDKDRRQQDDIWTIFRQGERIVFHAYHALHLYDGEKIDSLWEEDLLMSPQMLENGDLLVWKRATGPAVLPSGESTLRPLPPPPFRSPIASVLPAGDESYYVFTYREGIYRMQGDEFTPFPTRADHLLRSLIPRQAVVDSFSGNLVVGTHLDGMLLISPQGELLWWLGSRNNGIPAKQVFGMEMDRSGNLWLAMERGLAKISLSTSVRLSEELDTQFGTLNTAAYQAPYLYLGTSTGLWRGVFPESFDRLDHLERIPAVATNVLDLTVEDGQLFCGTNGPTYEIFPDRVRPACPATGGAEMDRGFIHGKEVLVQRTYSDLCLYLRENGIWTYSHALEGRGRNVRGLKIDADGSIWLRIPFGGLHHIRLDETLREVSSYKVFDVLGTQDATLSTISRFGKRVLFTSTLAGFYTYDDIQDSIVRYDRLSHMSKALSLERLSSKDYAFRFREGTVFVREHQDSLETLAHLSHEMLGGKAPDGLRRLVPLPGDRYLFLRENSLALCRVLPREEASPSLSLSRFATYDFGARKDSLFALDGPSPRIPSNFQRIQLQYAFPRFGLSCDPSFRYRLTHGRRTGEWEELGATPEIVLHYLHEGRYSVQVEARSMDGQVLSTYSHSFVVRPPLRRSPPMVVLYFLFAILIPFTLIMLSRKLSLSRQETKIIQYESKLHKNELDALRSELTLRTASVIHWNEVLQKIKDLIGQQKARLGKDYPDKDYRAVCEMIDREIVDQTDWSLFQDQFNKAYDNFLGRLHEAFPDLTETDLRYCAYFRMGKNSREVGSIMHVTQRGAETARYRIKKKIGLTEEQALDAFLKTF